MRVFNIHDLIANIVSSFNQVAGIVEFPCSIETVNKRSVVLFHFCAICMEGMRGNAFQTVDLIDRWICQQCMIDFH